MDFLSRSLRVWLYARQYFSDAHQHNRGHTGTADRRKARRPGAGQGMQVERLLRTRLTDPATDDPPRALPEPAVESVKLVHKVSGVWVETEVMREMRRASTAADGLEGQLVPGWQACLSKPFFSTFGEFYKGMTEGHETGDAHVPWWAEAVKALARVLRPNGTRRDPKLESLRKQIHAIKNLREEPLQMRLHYLRVMKSEGANSFEKGMIAASKRDGSTCDANERSGSSGGGSGWMYGWTIVDSRIKWGSQAK